MHCPARMPPPSAKCKPQMPCCSAVCGPKVAENCPGTLKLRITVINQKLDLKCPTDTGTDNIKNLEKKKLRNK